ncbi:hypothetical protein TanjilG_13139 [Lupinus angustifolius]|uniref:Uncharacterized protein n=1 Tax=Lupinus angustifolius TaxID=3871 RepID=A0A1J7HGA8_LUPAN|nr:hypothetical protein TanjilG_13139 [Lupinus angustifolius]
MTKSCEHMRTKNHVMFSESEIKVAKLLIQLSISNNTTGSNNKADIHDDAKSSIAATTTRDDDEEE